VYGRSDASDTTSIVQTKETGKKAQKKKEYEVDATGKKIRGRSDEKPKDYDQYVFSIYSKYVNYFIWCDKYDALFFLNSSNLL
jgi:hypothetical protein